MTDSAHSPDPRHADSLADSTNGTFPYLAFTADHDRTDACRCFVARYGSPPLRIMLAGGILLVGPIPDCLHGKKD